jgi:glycosyltransferase involved in cell wall biosynthesis
MTGLPRISVVTISFNQGGFLRECVESVLNQRYTNLEYIVVDAGSSDASRAILERYRDRVARLVFEPDDGPADGLNKGFAAATGGICAFLNADDRYLPGALDRAARFFLDHPGFDVVSGTIRQVDADGRPRLRSQASDRFDLARYAAGVCLVGQQATFFRREVFARAGGFNAANRINWDSELWVDMALAGARFAVVRDVLADFRLHPAGITGSRAHIERIRAEDRRLRGKLEARGIRLHRPQWERCLRLAYKFSPARHLRAVLAERRVEPAGWPLVAADAAGQPS